MQQVEPREEYHNTVGYMMKQLRENTGKEKGDPAKAAQAIITIVNEDNPPLRLLLGSEAVELANAMDNGKLEETKRWEAIRRSTDF
ncbi:hypothetical protein [Cohnella sp. JJ-181]|uniref:hypothetical protein n=1 Tax=Cohnella rhizoplanae TaxID=2974897 RepID=UPI00232FAD22|nr:hypothetical protein [Cohnella sp. JJ-181]